MGLWSPYHTPLIIKRRRRLELNTKQPTIMKLSRLILVTLLVAVTADGKFSIR